MSNASKTDSRGWLGHAHRWDSSWEAMWFINMRRDNPNVGRLLRYREDGVIKYYEREYLRTAGFHEEY